MAKSLQQQADEALKAMTPEQIQTIELAIKEDPVTTVEHMSPILQKAFAKQITNSKKAVALKKAREVRLSNMANPELMAAKELRPSGDYWADLFLTLLRNREVKGLQAAKEVVVLTDQILEFIKEEGKIL